MKKVREFLNAKVAAVVGLFALASSQANAQLDTTELTSQITTGIADVGGIGGIVLGFSAAMLVTWAIVSRVKRGG